MKFVIALLIFAVFIISSQATLFNEETNAGTTIKILLASIDHIKRILATKEY